MIGLPCNPFPKSRSGLGMPSRRRRHRVLRGEALEPRAMLSGLALAAWSSERLAYAAGVTATRDAAPSVASPISINAGADVLGTTASLSVLGKDDGGEANLTYTWSMRRGPRGGSVSFSANGTNDSKVATATFTAGGTYRLSVKIVDAGGRSRTASKSVKVVATVTTVAVSPGAASLLLGGTQQFAARALDQFGRPIARQPAFSWSATSGTISASGLFNAPASGSSCTVTAQCGSASALVRGTATVTLIADSSGYQNPALAQLVASLDADGAINRGDMIQILRATGSDGTVTASELADLRRVLSQASTLNIPEYVQVLAGDVINGNAANTTFQGQTLGNLAAGSSATQLNTLIDKWFYGADHPTLCNGSFVYRTASGSLFPHTPSHLDEVQGALGDCYFISALGTLADSNPAAVRNMFIDNGDGTFTVRFYTGTYGSIYNGSDGSISAGFKEGVGTADYVTVDLALPTTSTGRFAYANYGASCSDPGNALWIPLAEKAYAQWNETGKAGRDGTNAYASIEGGWMGTVDAQVLGYNATDYIMTHTGRQVAIDALAAHKAVTIGTLSWSGTYYGLYGNHAYAIVGYNATSDTFTLYNPWGTSHPGPLSWSQLQSACSQLVVADASETMPIPLTAQAAAAAALEQLRHEHVSTSRERLSAALVDALLAEPS